MLEIIDATYLLYLNQTVGVGHVLNPTALNSALSSWHYYHTRELQLASIFRGLVKNHPFADGNKRTAVEFLLIEIELGNMAFSKTDDQLFDLVLRVASENLSVEEIARLIFGD